jgi:hypothetical protein
VLHNPDGAPDDPDEVWREHPRGTRRGAPVACGHRRAAQFLAASRKPLNPEARDRFLDYLYEDLTAAMRRVVRLARGDYSPDKDPERFPVRGRR